MKIRSTTVLCVRRGNQVTMGCDGQVTVGTTVMKHNAKKMRRMHHDTVLSGFAGATADAFTLFEKFEAKLAEYRGNLARAAAELAKDSFIISGTGDVVEPEDGILAIGSGGPYALASARALLAHSDLAAEQIVKESLMIAGGIDIYTNQQIVIESLTR